ncbi:hypothetical protein EVAR_62663_1 [Eumeta japonica]|uniref:Uncharacterized protein n=1 Tax=Eumeta variegata TaxID=151549 RepID=A0A4C1Z524_EUMVA|nr:hypothetical protein EVAR_62663_1 [Eumeta japonica]
MSVWIFGGTGTRDTRRRPPPSLSRRGYRFAGNQHSADRYRKPQHWAAPEQRDIASHQSRPGAALACSVWHSIQLKSKQINIVHIVTVRLIEDPEYGKSDVSLANPFYTGGRAGKHVSEIRE